MSEIIRIKKEINELRKKMQWLIDDRENLLDPDIIGVSESLDMLLNEYLRLLNEDIK